MCFLKVTLFILFIVFFRVKNQVVVICFITIHIIVFQFYFILVFIAIHFIFAMTEAMYAQVFIIILGLVPVSGSNWGIMLYFAQGQGALYFRDSIWYILSPILAISLVQLSLVSFASALEDIFNPRLRGSA